jgi:predicted transcriptional regulator of viral defense system
MKLTDAHARLIALGKPVLTTRDAGALLGVSAAHAAQILRRLAKPGHVVRLRRGRWALVRRLDPFALPEALTSPKPSYVSLYSALYRHGMIEQIPSVIYAVTLAPTRRVQTPFGTVSLHQVAPSFFTGFDVIDENAVKLASPEKALVDVLYLKPGRSRLFRALPELELPPRFSRKRAHGFARLIVPEPRRIMVERELSALLVKTK